MSTPVLTDDRREEIRQLAIDAINWMGGHFCQALVELATVAEADYALRLWPHVTRTTPTSVTYGRPPDRSAYHEGALRC